MAKLIILGSSNAIPDEHHENTHMALVGDKHIVLIDCVSNPILRLPQAGIEFDALTDLVLTHFHPDHVSGVPLLLMNMWLMGRKKPLDIYGLHHTLSRVEELMGFYAWENWPNFFPVVFHRLPQEEMTLVLENDEFRILASPVKHMIPTIGLRLENIQSHGSAAYSCDTEPCDQVVRLASGTDFLIHEATGAGFGHSSAAQAGEIASQAGVERLYLIHYTARGSAARALLAEAQSNYNGKAALAEDFMQLEF